MRARRLSKAAGTALVALLCDCGQVVLTGSPGGGAAGTTSSGATSGGAGAGGESSAGTAGGGSATTTGAAGTAGDTTTGSGGSGGSGGVTITGGGGTATGGGGSGGGTTTGGSGGMTMTTGSGGMTMTTGSGGSGGMTMTTGSGGSGGMTTTGSGGMTMTTGSGGACLCASNADCAPSIFACKESVCAACICQLVDAPDGAPLPDLIVGDCLGSVCLGGAEAVVADDSDVPDDGNDCTIEACFNGMSVSGPAPAGSPCVDVGGQVCDGNGTCVECLSNADCLSPTEVCVQSVCVTKTGNGGPCATGSTCLSGFCADGVCCQSACTSLCKACVATKTGQPDGVCANILAGTDPDNECPGPLTCAFGGCPIVDPGGCTTGAECPSGFCVDGVCCNTACQGLCQACSTIKKGAGANGTCGFIAAGTDPDNECAGPLVCVNGICN